MNTTLAPATTWHTRLAELLALEAQEAKHNAEIHDPLAAALCGLFPQWPTLDAEGRAEAQRWMEESRYNESAEISDALGERCGELESELIRSPAPDRSAALWKFRRLYGSQNSGTGEWLPEFVAQAHIDIERYLEN